MYSPGRAHAERPVLGVALGRKEQYDEQGSVP